MVLATTCSDTGTPVKAVSDSAIGSGKNAARSPIASIPALGESPGIQWPPLTEAGNDLEVAWQRVVPTLEVDPYNQFLLQLVG